jgi:hypothetical protein
LKSSVDLLAFWRVADEFNVFGEEVQYECAHVAHAGGVWVDWSEILVESSIEHLKEEQD